MVGVDRPLCGQSTNNSQLLLTSSQTYSLTLDERTFATHSVSTTVASQLIIYDFAASRTVMKRIKLLP